MSAASDLLIPNTTQSTAPASSKSTISVSPSKPPVSDSAPFPIPSSPPVPDSSTAAAADRDADPGKASDSEAETIVLEGKNAASKPSSPDKKIKHEDVDHNNGNTNLDSDEDAPGDVEMEDAPPIPSSPRPAKKSKVETVKNDKAESLKDPAPSVSPPKDRVRSMTKPRKRKHGDDESEDDAKSASSTPHPQHDSKDRRETRSNTARPSSPKHTSSRASRDRSSSPRAKHHRRAASLQSPHTVTNGQGSKRRKLPPPLLSSRERRNIDDQNSDSSDTSASPHPTTQLRKPSAVESSALSPAKLPPHKKLRDQIGRTQLARACANGEYDLALQRLKDRPQDIDEADYAGNTPLQIASLAGSVDIVKLLIDHGCDVTCKNKEKDTPLIDAVENGHVQVARMLLAAGANPKQGNAKGEEPLDLLDEDDEDYVALKKVLMDAIKKGTPRRISEDQSGSSNHTHKEKDKEKENYGRSSRGASTHSPRHSPPVSASRSPPPAAFNPPRRRNARSEVSRNDLLWMSASVERLRELAGKGDLEGVGRILEMRPQSDIEAFIAAARGGHDEVMQLLLAMGNAEPDPEPIKSNNYKSGYNTPMLAAIGRGSDKVIKLLLEQQNFDPTRLDPKGRTYYEVAKDRQGFGWEKEYELLKGAYDKHPKGRKQRLTSGKHTSSESSRKDREHKRLSQNESSSPSLSKQTRSPGHKSGDSGVTSKHLKRSSTESVGSKSEKLSKSSSKLTARPSESSAVSDGESVPHAPPRPKVKRSESDAAKPRRKLVSGKTLKTEQEKSKRMSKSDSESERKTEKPTKHRDKVKSEDSRNRLEVVRNEATSKRSRDSVSPQRSSSIDSESRRVSDDLKKKRRRIDSEGHDAHSKRSSNLSNGDRVKSKDESSTKSTIDGTSKPRNIKSEVSSLSAKSSLKAPRSVSPDHNRRKDDSLHVTKKRESKIAKEDPAAIKLRQEKEKQEKIEQEQQAQLQREQAEELARIQKKADEEERDKREKAAKEEAEREAKLARERAEKAKEAEEAERKARLAREAEEAAERRRREEEAQRRRLEQEQRRREEAERRRREAEQHEREEQLRRQQEEERRRIEALPNRLRIQAEKPMHEVRTPEEARSFMPLFTATRAEIDPSHTASDPAAASERYIANFQAAPVLGEKDLALSQFTAWSKRPFTPDQAWRMWRITRVILVGRPNPSEPNAKTVTQMMHETEPKYQALQPKFWIRVSDFEDMVPRYPHLNGLKLRYIKTDLTFDFAGMEEKAASAAAFASRSGSPNGTAGPGSTNLSTPTPSRPNSYPPPPHSAAPVQYPLHRQSQSPTAAPGSAGFYPPTPHTAPMQQLFQELDREAPELPYQDRKVWDGVRSAKRRVSEREGSTGADGIGKTHVNGVAATSQASTANINAVNSNANSNALPNSNGPVALGHAPASNTVNPAPQAGLPAAPSPHAPTGSAVAGSANS